MKLSTQTDVLSRRYGDEKAVEMLAKAGYDAIDISCFEMASLNSDSPKSSDGFREYAKRLKAIADDNGVYFNQAHAPFPSSQTDDKVEYNAAIGDIILRSMEFCSLLGVRNIVVHPKQHLTYAEGDNKRILRDINIEFYKSLVPYCRDLNIHVALENMWQYDVNRKISHSTCSTPEEFNEYLDLIDSPWIVGCLDVGHAFLCDVDIPEFIKSTAPRLKALHVHDTGYNIDLHRLPYTCGGIDWISTLQALKDSHYDGELTFEADNTLVRMPDSLIEPTVEYMAKIGKGLISIYDSLPESK